jgi:hypothetical protein
MFSPRTRRVAIDGLVRDIQPAPTGQAVELAPSLFPGKRRPRLIVVLQVGEDRPVLARLFDRPPRHGGLPVAITRSHEIGGLKRMNRSIMTKAPPGMASGPADP